MTKKQKQLLEFIERFIAQQGYAPSYREIMSSLGYKSVSTVATHVDNLIVLGYLEKRDHSARSLRLSGKEITQKSTPVVVTTAQEKWLIDKVAEKFHEVEKTLPRNEAKIDELFILVGALQLLGLTSAAIAYKTRLSTLKKGVPPQIE